MHLSPKKDKSHLLANSPATIGSLASTFVSGSLFCDALSNPPPLSQVPGPLWCRLVACGGLLIRPTLSNIEQHAI
jgi:hypothetical protein